MHLLSDSVDRLPVVAVDPGKTTGLVVIEEPPEAVMPEGFWAKVAPDNEPVPYRDRLAFWQRVKARRAEKAADRAREDQDISMWLAEKAPTATEEIAQDTIDRQLGMFSQISVGSIVADQIVATSIEWPVDPTPVSSARSTRRQVEVLDTIDVDEVFWDIASMIDAHRNGATALERPLGPTQGLVGETPVWDELTKVKWDPTHEMGPRERQYIRKLAKS